ncbi:MAG TPA: class I SAM-dependent methyltransferase [Candidatus Coprousia avicola]|nr:class I SAM-dependent methyltransferase [Candidatus Coprousia avicola]
MTNGSSCARRGKRVLVSSPCGSIKSVGWKSKGTERSPRTAACAGSWSMVLTPTRPVPRTWFFADMRGVRVLGLAAGGGQRMPLFAAMGAECTVLDYSERQLASERLVAAREGYEITCVRADMTRPLPFADASFDLIFHPVANCYVEEVLPIWRECARVLRPGGRLLAGLDNGFNYVVDDDEERIVRGLPFNPLRDPDLISEEELPDWGVQFSHTLDEQIRGQIQAGLRLLDLYEDTNGGESRLHRFGIPTFWATLAEKPSES